MLDRDSIQCLGRTRASYLPPILTVGPIFNFYLFPKVDFCTRSEGQLLTAPRTRVTGKVNPTTETGLFGPSVKLGVLASHPTTNPHDETNSTDFRSQIHLDSHPLWGGVCQGESDISETGRFGLIVRVGGTLIVRVGGTP